MNAGRSPHAIVLVSFKLLNGTDASCARYCNFRKKPRTSPWLTVESARSKLEMQRSKGVREVLIMSGEIHPLSRRRKPWIERVIELCETALAMGLHPVSELDRFSPRISHAWLSPCDTVAYERGTSKQG